MKYTVIIGGDKPPSTEGKEKKYTLTIYDVNIKFGFKEAGMVAIAQAERDKIHNPRVVVIRKKPNMVGVKI